MTLGMADVAFFVVLFVSEIFLAVWITYSHAYHKGRVDALKEECVDALKEEWKWLKEEWKLRNPE